tara:strand:- start:575 stop:985 length:411 start_codon:yes stop_codon:yes gene_type:complete
MREMNIAMTVNFYNDYHNDYCIKTIRHCINKANRRLFGRQHKHIKGIGYVEGQSNKHLHLALHCPLKLANHFHQLVLNELVNKVPSISTYWKKNFGKQAKSTPIKIDPLCGTQNIIGWNRYSSKQQTTQFDNSFVI